MPTQDITDRVGTIRAAAKAAGVHEAAAYLRVRAAGLTMGRPPSRVCTAQEKPEFFRLLEEGQNVSVVARELGFNRVTGNAGPPATNSESRSSPGSNAPATAADAKTASAN